VVNGKTAARNTTALEPSLRGKVVATLVLLKATTEEVSGVFSVTKAKTSSVTFSLSLEFDSFPLREAYIKEIITSKVKWENDGIYRFGKRERGVKPPQSAKRTAVLTAVRKSAVSVTANTGHMCLLISICTNSAPCCWKNCKSRPCRGAKLYDIREKVKFIKDKVII
jgi:hypothetical protein